MTGARLTVVSVVSALAAACAGSPDGGRVGERVLPDTHTVAEHFQRAVAMQGAYGFQLPTPPEERRPAPPSKRAPAAKPEPAKSSWWSWLWPASQTTTLPPPRPAPQVATVSQPEYSTWWERFWPPLTPAKTETPRARPVAAAPTAATAAMSPPRPTVAAAAAAPRPAPTPSTTASSGGSGLSEFRLGALKHAVAFGHRAKEQGMDGNVEALFRSPDWLAWAWAPRPHLGLTANASTRATDFLYGGLTWEWTYRDALFADLGVGLSVHDGMLDNSMIEGKERFDRREFGCRMLFRGSVEFGYRFLERHSLSLMWAHHSHGQVCSEENEGIDNAGLRYGFRM